MRLSIIIFAIFLGAFFFVPSAYADCNLTSATMGPGSLRTGDPSTSTATITVNGEGCNGLQLRARILHYNTDVEINSVSILFPNTGTVARGVYIFNTRDVPEGQTATFKARINAHGSSASVTTGGVLVTGGSCQLSQPGWNASDAGIGQTLTMSVQGQGCSGYAVSFDVYRNATWARDDYIETVRTTFPQGSTTARANVVISGSEWGAEKDMLNDASIDVYFIAKAGVSQAPQSPNAKISANYVGAPGTGGGGQGTGNTTPTPVTGGGGPIDFRFSFDNPLGPNGPTNLLQLIEKVARWIMALAIPVAVIFIIYGGILFLMAGQKPDNVQKGKDILKYAIIGLAIVLIGNGFVSLVRSVIQLGGSDTPPTQQP